MLETGLEALRLWPFTCGVSLNDALDVSFVTTGWSLLKSLPDWPFLSVPWSFLSEGTGDELRLSLEWNAAERLAEKFRRRPMFTIDVGARWPSTEKGKVQVSRRLFWKGAAAS